MVADEPTMLLSIAADDGGLLRLGVFASFLLGFMALEMIRPRRRVEADRRRRWPLNIAFSLAITTMFAVLPLLAAGAAAWAEARSIGVFNLVDGPWWLEAIAGFLLLDMVLYWQHRWFHRVPFFWRFHRVHHSDRHLDTTSGVRFHPGEALVSLGIKIVAIVLLGPAVWLVLLFEMILNAASLFNHSNLALGSSDRWLRWFIVTPEMHLVHHSRLPGEANHNFSFFLSVWDRLFDSYQARPVCGIDGMELGLEEVGDTASLSFGALMALPLRHRPHGRMSPLKSEAG